MDSEKPEETVSTAKKLSRSLDAVVFKVIRIRGPSRELEIPKGLKDAEVASLLVARYFNSQPNLVQSILLSAYYKLRHVLVSALKRVVRIIRGNSQ